MAINNKMRNRGRLSEPCMPGWSEDCDGNCFLNPYFYYYIGDGKCDDGPPPYPNFNCAAFNYDGGDCDGNGGNGATLDPTGAHPFHSIKGGGRKFGDYGPPVRQRGGRVRRQRGGRSGVLPKPWDE